MSDWLPISLGVCVLVWLIGFTGLLISFATREPIGRARLRYGGALLRVIALLAMPMLGGVFVMSLALRVAELSVLFALLGALAVVPPVLAARWFVPPLWHSYRRAVDPQSTRST